MTAGSAPLLLEKGRYDPSLPLVFRLARVFFTTIEDLFNPSDEDLASTANSDVDPVISPG